MEGKKDPFHPIQYTERRKEEERKQQYSIIPQTVTRYDAEEKENGETNEKKKKKKKIRSKEEWHADIWFPRKLHGCRYGMTRGKIRQGDPDMQLL
jgi:hypothetical protein